MSDFRSFKGKSQNKSNNNNKQNEIKNILSGYSGKTEKEMFDELADRYEKEVAEGKMDSEKLKKIVGVLDAYLDESQREKLKSIIGRLENK